MHDSAPSLLEAAIGASIALAIGFGALWFFAFAAVLALLRAACEPRRA